MKSFFLYCTIVKNLHVISSGFGRNVEHRVSLFLPNLLF